MCAVCTVLYFIVLFEGFLLTGGGPPRGTREGHPPGGVQHHLDPKMGRQRGVPDTISQPDDPGGVGRYQNVKMQKYINTKMSKSPNAQMQTYKM